jgi:hypothetical protein
MNPRIIHLTDKDLNWSFDDDGKPTYCEKNRFSYNHHIKVDPFPCYHHDLELVERTVSAVEHSYPIGCLPMWYILSHEFTHRTNGWCRNNFFYDADEEKAAGSAFEPVITLSGKRIPIMPTMTRYLVSHEYGHAVEAWVRSKMGIADNKRDDFLAKYAEIRGMVVSKQYGARNWHKHVGEVFANDFRIIITGYQSEFWPHEANHPHENDAILDYWFQTLLPLQKQELDYQI